MDTKYQQIVAGFRTSEAFAEGQKALRDRKLSNFSLESPAELNNVPQQRRPDSQSGLPYAAALGGLAGAGMGAFISALATNLPNLPSLQGSSTELFVLVPLGGALLGAIASSLLALLSGANPEESDFAYYKILAQPTSNQEAQKISEILVEAGGRLL